MVHRIFLLNDQLTTWGLQYNSLKYSIYCTINMVTYHLSALFLVRFQIWTPFHPLERVHIVIDHNLEIITVFCTVCVKKLYRLSFFHKTSLLGPDGTKFK